MGYVDGAGLGPDGEGILNPIKVNWKADKKGLGDEDAAAGNGLQEDERPVLEKRRRGECEGV